MRPTAWGSHSAVSQQGNGLIVERETVVSLNFRAQVCCPLFMTRSYAGQPFAVTRQHGQCPFRVRAGEGVGTLPMIFGRCDCPQTP
jgi:hypothetical protein